MDKLVEKLKELGFNTYEAKVYVALLKKHPITGYEVSKIANIPQSRTYDTLKVLEKKEIVISNKSKPAEYIPVKPKEITKRFKKKMLLTVDYLDSHLPEIKEEYNEPIQNVVGSSDVHQKVLEAIRSAEKDIYMEVWSKDFPIFEEELKNAYNRNVEIRIVGYDNLKINFGLVYQHPFSKAIMNNIDGRNFMICVDGMIGGLGKLYNNSGSSLNILWSKNKDFVYLIKEFIVHDMIILDVQENMLNEMTYMYGKGMKRLHDKILGSNNIYNS